MRVDIDEREQSVGWKFNECELRGIPLRLEIGPKDIENGKAVLVRRDNFEKISVDLENVVTEVQQLLVAIHANMLKTARDFRESHTFVAHNFEEFMEGIEKAMALSKLCGAGKRIVSWKLRRKPASPPAARRLRNMSTSRMSAYIAANPQKTYVLRKILLKAWKQIPERQPPVRDFLCYNRSDLSPKFTTLTQFCSILAKRGEET